MARAPSATNVVIIGAGPYGLSLAAHLRHRGAEFRIFGSPMYAWRRQMPAGMYLKSEGFASNISDPQRQYTLARYCAEQGIDAKAPISLETFVAYGMWFKQHLVDDVEETEVSEVRRSGDAFTVRLSNGESLRARRVVVATGLGFYSYVPSMLAALPQELVSHSSQHSDVSALAGQCVAVIGGGQSALETATLLHEHGASVYLLVRKPALAWNETPDPQRPLHNQIRYPIAGLGAGWPGWFYEHVPSGTHYFPQHIRVRLARESYGPAGAWWLKPRAIGRFPMHLQSSVRAAVAKGNGVCLRVSCQDGKETMLTVDHVIAATGFHVDIQRLPFLHADLLSQVRRIEDAPMLSRFFESSVPGLYFIGITAANSFGPLLRFVLGTGFTGPRLGQHLASRAAG